MPKTAHRRASALLFEPHGFGADPVTQLGSNIPELRGAYKFETLNWAELFSVYQEKPQDITPEKEAVETADTIFVETSQPEGRGTLGIHEAADLQVEILEDAKSASREIAKVQELSSCQAVQNLSPSEFDHPSKAKDGIHDACHHGTENKSRQSVSLGDLVGLALRYPQLHGSELCERYQEADPIQSSALQDDAVCSPEEKFIEVSPEPVADDHVLMPADEPVDVVAGSQEKEQHAEVSQEPAADDHVPMTLGEPGGAAVCSQEEKVIEVSPEPVADDPGPGVAEEPGDAAVSQVCLEPSTEDHATPTLEVPCDTSSCHGQEKDAAVSKEPQTDSAALVPVIRLLLRHPGLSGAELAEKARESGEAGVGSSDNTSVVETRSVDHAQLVTLIGRAIKSPRRGTIA